MAIDYCCAALNFSGAGRTWTIGRPLPQGAAGLDKDNVVLCHPVTTLDRAKLKQRIGELTSLELSQVEDGLKAAMDLF